MREEDAKRLSGLFQESEPRAVIQRYLAYLVQDHCAQGGLIAFAQDDGAVVEMVRSMRADRLAVFALNWSESLEAVGKGDTVRSDRYLMAPVIEAKMLLGALYLDTPTRTADLARPLREIGKWMLSVMSNPEPILTLAPRESCAKMWRRVLEENNWNVMKTAQAMKVTRRTVYQKAKRYGIDIQRGRMA